VKVEFIAFTVFVVEPLCHLQLYPLSFAVTCCGVYGIFINIESLYEIAVDRD
jgi:hypothetical protein